MTYLLEQSRILRCEFVHSFDSWPMGTTTIWAPRKERTQQIILFDQRRSVRDAETMVNAPNLIPEFGQLLLVFWIKSEFWLRVNDDPGIESSTTEHHCRFDVGVSIKDALCIPC